MTQPWETEPDSDRWLDPDTGLQCIAARGPLGHWCGYVGVDSEHPFYGANYSDNCWPGGPTLESILRCHGGLTYSEPWHKPEDMPHLWFFGFDCAHSGDCIPQLDYTHELPYRNLEFVKAECTRLAQQLAGPLPTQDSAQPLSMTPNVAAALGALQTYEETLLRMSPSDRQALSVELESLGSLSSTLHTELFYQAARRLIPQTSTLGAS